MEYIDNVNIRCEMSRKKTLANMTHEEIAEYVGSHDVSNLGVKIEDELEIDPELKARILARRKCGR